MPIGKQLERMIRTILAVAPGIGLAAAAPLQAQITPVAEAAQTAIPEPIYWKQTLFQIPYQWSSAAEPGAAQVVWLLVSKDRGATWQKISEARPNVTSFSYRAEGDGEYWFAVRTIDKLGRAWPEGDYRPELRVIVDTAIPRIESVSAVSDAGGGVDLTWNGFDTNLDPASWKFEAQYQPNGPWQAIGLNNTTSPAIAVGQGSTEVRYAGRASWQPPVGQTPIAIRVSVADRAGNSASYRTDIRASSPVPPSVVRLPVPPAALATSQTVTNPFYHAGNENIAPSSAPALPATTREGWNSGSPASLPVASSQPAEQPWPASASANPRIHLWSDQSPVSANDRVTVYGTPRGVGHELAGDANITAEEVEATQAGRQRFQPLQPFRQASVSRQSESTNAPTLDGNASATSDGEFGSELPPSSSYDNSMNPLPPGVQPKFVASRTFALEYDLEVAARQGVSQVEVWGTRDGGQSWRVYARDDDHRSPIIVTVSEEGVYGFRIVVQGDAANRAEGPQAGDAPELWVAVDLGRPAAEITAIERGTGNLADHLIIRWRADDDNLEPRPVSLFYSSRPNGNPWSAVATNLENTGYYAWRVERHVPQRFYLRLEARDTAGNLAAFQTREPIEFENVTPAARFDSVEALRPIADENASFR